MSRHDTVGRSTSILRELVQTALVRSANAPLLGTPNPHRNHRVLGDPRRVDELIDQWPSAVDQIIYRNDTKGRHREPLLQTEFEPAA